MKKIAFIFISFFFSSVVYAQDTITSNSKVDLTTPNSQINYKDLAIVATIIPITTTGVYIYLNNVWWKRDKAKFHITDKLELKYALNLDKAGHYYSSYLVTNVFSDVLLLCGLSKNQSLWGGASLSIINSTIVEIKDGYSPYWGFSKFDMLANISGALYPVLQHNVPVFQNFNFKWSYDFSHPSYYKTLPGHENKTFIDDYERQNFWVTMDVANLFFSEKNHSKFPYFLDLAFGMSAQNIDGKGAGQHEWFIGLDLNFTKLSFTKSKIEPVIYKYLNYYHTPAPAVRLSPQNTWYPITY